MLKGLSDWNDTERAALRWTYWTAFDLEHGARLMRSAGRGKGGLNKYVLLLNGKAYADIHDLYAERLNFTRRAFIRAWHDAEALELANARLAKLLRKA